MIKGKKKYPLMSRAAKKRIGKKNPFFGKAHTKESKIKIGLAAKGRRASIETRKKISESNKGRKVSKETRKKISDAKKGKKGRKMSDKHKSIISKSSTGNSYAKGYKHTKSALKKISEAAKGSKCHFWKGGITEISKAIRTCTKYRQWRSDVFTRDDFTCQECGGRSGNGKAIILNAHHIKMFSMILDEYKITTISEALKCAELWNINNGRTLCLECHLDIHSKINNITRPKILSGFDVD